MVMEAASLSTLGVTTNLTALTDLMNETTVVRYARIVCGGDALIFFLLFGEELLDGAPLLTQKIIYFLPIGVIFFMCNALFLS